MNGEMARAYFREPEIFTPGYYIVSGQEFRCPPLYWIDNWDQWCVKVDELYAKYGMYRVEVTDAGESWI